MNKESITVSGVLIMNWYNLLVLMIWCACMSTLVNRIESLVWSLLVYFALVVASAVVALLIYTFVFMDQVTLSAEGIIRKNRFRTQTTGWDQIIQTGFIADRSPRVLVLVRSGGTKRKEPDSNLLFHLRNTGKLIAIPDESGVAELVNRCYGPPDFDLSDKSKN